MGLKDGRLKLMNQILSGVKVSFVCPVLVISCYSVILLCICGSLNIISCTLSVVSKYFCNKSSLY